MLTAFAQHLHKNFPFLKHKKLLITVSGGIDSVVLTAICKQLDYNIGIAHCNFQLRDKESDLDEQFVMNLALEKQVPFHTIQFNTKEYCKKNKVSTQIGARELRYNWFYKLLEQHPYDYILTAHHLNDVMETFFINLSRGTGIDGLSGIPPINNKTVRPLLPFSRKDIEQYAHKNNISWREDKSNAETKYLRNKIRHKIVPELYELNSNFEHNFKTTITNIFSSSEFINLKIEELKKTLFKPHKNGFEIEREQLNQLSNYEIHSLFKAYGFTSATEIFKLLKSQAGKYISSNSHTLLSNRTSLILTEKQTTTETQQSYSIQHSTDTMHLPIQLSFHANRPENTNHSICVPLDASLFPLTLRKRKEGDVFYPTGMQGKKKVSKYFKDLKLSQLEKEDTWLLCNSEDRIIWIVGYRSDKNFIAKTNPSNFIWIAYL